jgi:4-alpha-glucanotransferase
MGDVAWLDWPDPLRRRVPDAIAVARARLADAVGERIYVQWQLDRQWRKARGEAEAAGVTLMGDLPFMVAGDSADVWQRANEFRLDARLGVPPDAFSEDGQDWGLPVYRWNVMEGNDFHWLRERAARAAELYGIYRVDHVVGFFRTYFREHGPKSPGEFTPSVEAEQVKLGEKVLAALGADENRVIAEDLGVIPKFVRASLTKLEVPGYKVVRWEKDEDDAYRDPAGYPACSVATTGTHDTESVAEWYDGLAEEERAEFLKIPGMEALAERVPAPEKFDEGVRDAVLALTYGATSDLVLIPFQDCFGLRDRINVPGTVGGGNWTYRMAVGVEGIAAAETERLAGLARAAKRST